MAKLYFYYSAMNAGKSTMLLQSAYNYKERGMDTLTFIPAIDQRYGKGKISSRLGLSANAITFDNQFNFYEHIKIEKNNNSALACILIDEAQFLSKEQAWQLTAIVDKLDLPVLAFGIRSDFQGEPFSGSMALLVLADNIVELKTICFCGKKAIMNTRIDANGRVVRNGAQIAIGGNESYIATCRKHFKEIENIKDVGG